jgi:hypothetical protein
MLNRSTLVVVGVTLVAAPGCSRLDVGPLAPELAQPSESQPTDSKPLAWPRAGLPFGTNSISGTVYALTPQGREPLVDADVNAWVELNGFGFSYWYGHGPVRSGGDGHFTLPYLPDGAVVQVTAHKAGLTQQCASPQVTAAAGFQRVDAYLAPRESLLESRASLPAAAAGYRMISGVVYQGTGANRLPAEDVWVAYEPFMEIWAAVTFTDSEGRFLLCGIPEESAVWVGAWLDAHRSEYVEVPAGPDTGIVVEFR